MDRSAARVGPVLDAPATASTGYLDLPLESDPEEAHAPKVPPSFPDDVQTIADAAAEMVASVERIELSSGPTDTGASELEEGSLIALSRALQRDQTWKSK